MSWESTSAKAQLRSTIQRLGQLQAKKDADASITRKDIATLLQQGNVALARSKAQKLIQEDSLGDLLEVLEQQVGTLLDRFSELEQRLPPSPALLEAASSVIFAAPHTQIRGLLILLSPISPTLTTLDLNVVSNLISDRLGPEAARSARDNKDSHVSPRVLRATSRPTPSAAQLDAYLERIARSYGVSWTAGPQRQNLVNPLSEVLDPSAVSLVDMTRLRHLCIRGIPDEPGWLRPRIWKLFLNVLPIDKTAWEREITKQRDSYYDLVRRLLRPFADLPPPIKPVSGADETLLEVYKHLARIPVELFGQLESDPDDLDACPLHQGANEDTHIPFANCLDTRLHLLRRLNESDQNNSTMPPEIRLETNPDVTPAISLTPNDNNTPMTLLSSRSISLGSASQRHASALLRLLYIHASVNPGNLSPYVPSLLVPLYTALMQEIEPEDLAHAEADAFWLFEAFVAEFAELEDEEGSDLWMKRLGEVLGQKDPELLELLNDIGLHPSLPHYSRRWLSSLLTHTLPLTAIYPVWDVMLSRPARERGKHPRLDSLIEICTAMLIGAKPLIFKQGKVSGLWDRGPLASSVQPEEGFLDGLSILQSYPVDSLGGIDTILQLMVDPDHNRVSHPINGVGKKDQPGLGARLKVTMWKGFTNQIDSPEQSDDEEASSGNEEERIDDGNDTETPDKSQQPNSLTSRIANSVWRGITNQSSMDAPPSPVFVPSPEASRPATPPVPFKEHQGSSPGPEPPKENPTSAPANLWTYTERLKDSDTMATLAKLGSNWRAKAMLSSWGRPREPVSAPPAPPQETRSAVTSPVQKPLDPEFRRSSLPAYDHTGAVYTPPPRPAFFHNPRDSFISPEAAALVSSPTEMSHKDDSPKSEKSSAGLLEKTRGLQSTLLSLARTPSPKPPPSMTPKAAPRPLLLSSSSLITSHNSGRSRVTPSSTDGYGEDWADVMRLRKSHLPRDSMSSVSSLSPSDAIYRKPTRSECDSDANTSRIVPLNRRSVSPMAPALKSYHSRPPSSTSTASSEQAVPSTPAKEDSRDRQDTVDVASPKEEEITPNGKADAHVLSEHASLTRKTYRKKPQAVLSGDTSDSSVGYVNSRATRLRSKRYTPRLSNLHIDNTTVMEDTKASSPSNLTVPWPIEDQEMAATPRASAFDSNSLPPSPLKSPKVKEERPRKTSNNSRHRKLSNSNREAVHRRGDSAAEDGDDEGYDDLLSAYESEENSSLA